MKKIKWKSVNRKTHYWLSIVCALPLIIVIVTGIILQLKKDSYWVQPPTMRGEGTVPNISFERVLEIAKQVEVSQVNSWSDIDRLDVRPKKGVIKVRAKNRWEIQLDHRTGEVLQVAYRRSDLIESIHDGSFFSSYAKLWIFLPSAVILLVLWITGMYLFVMTLLAKNKKKHKKTKKSKV